MEMNEMTLDVRGKPCPEPVMEAREALLDPDVSVLSVLVDDPAAIENLTRMAQSLGCMIRQESPRQGETMLIITKLGSEGSREAKTRNELPRVSQPPKTARRVVALISAAVIGNGDEELGRVLMRSFIKTLKQAESRPATVIFLHRGVQLTSEGSELLDDLRELGQAGVELLSCGTCLDYYHLKEKLKVGMISNMFEIVSRLTLADLVIRV
jgi:selenium metabolism protein YedF